MKRRDFLRASGLAFAGTLLLPEVMRAQISAQKEDLPKMLAHFNVSENDLRKVMAVALEKGGDYADLYFFAYVFQFAGVTRRRRQSR